MSTLPEVVTAIEAIVQYNWADELRDFEQMTRDGEPTDSHVFRALVTLDNFINNTTYKPEDLINV